MRATGEDLTVAAGLFEERLPTSERTDYGPGVSDALRRRAAPFGMLHDCTRFPSYHFQ